MSSECVHEQIHYMGKGPLPDTNPDCRWNYVCRQCRCWIKFKRPIKLDKDDRHGKLPTPAYVSGPSPGVGYGVPQPTPVCTSKRIPNCWAGVPPFPVTVSPESVNGS